MALRPSYVKRRLYMMLPRWIRPSLTLALSLMPLAVTAREPVGGENAVTHQDDWADDEDWYSLFNGRNLLGWRTAQENPDAYAVEDGKIVIHGRRDHLFYVGPVANANFKNFHLRMHVFTYPRANSGIYFHTRWQARGWPSAGYEAQINATHRDRVKTGSVYGVFNILDDAPHEDKTWFLYEIIVQDQRITTKVDGLIIAEYVEKPEDIRGERKLSSGTIALQAHDRRSRVYFKNIFIRPIDDLFKGD